ncbi:hypothetical protein [Streptomyces longwoodensis]|uniref:hypothetical protein n=1 Tax=Streptomyces longwoodensis TaxID=68231 RepID=UPI0033ED9E81
MTSMTPSTGQSGARRLVVREDAPLFNADHARCPSGTERRAAITADVEDIAPTLHGQYTLPTLTIPLPGIVDEIGPRRPGAIYQTSEGRFEVLALITDPREAAQQLRRDDARWAVIVRDTLRPNACPFAVGSAWTMSDYLLREGAPAYVPVA